jgi:hypothetical protein
MAFQPFGYRFEVRSSLSPDKVKAAIRRRKRGWFEARNGIHGWVAGSVVFLQSGMDRNPPMLLARISHDHSGTRILGRAGYLGSTGVLLLAPIVAFFFYLMLTTSGLVLELMVASGALIALMYLVISISDKYRHNAEPLVRFLQNAVGKPQEPQPFANSFSKSLNLNISGSELDDLATPESVRDALSDIEGDGFIILSSGEETYLQTAWQDGGYVVEKREGDNQHHFRAARRGAAGDANFTFEETLAVFLAYGSSAPIPSFVEWKVLDNP